MRFTIASLCMFTLTVFGGSASANIVVAVDFGVTDIGSGSDVTPNDVQSGFDEISAPDNGDILGDQGSSATESGTFSGFGVTATRISGGGWRDRTGEVTGAGALGLGDLLEDWVSSGPLNVTLTGLIAGQDYILTTYHHESAFPSTTNEWTLDVDGNILAHGTVDVTTGLTPTISQGTGMLSSQFTAGSDPVVLIGEGALNGFTLAEVPRPLPEPTTFALALFAVLSLVLTGRRRR